MANFKMELIKNFLFFWFACASTWKDEATELLGQALIGVSLSLSCKTCLDGP